jgi:hypothetical protein
MQPLLVIRVCVYVCPEIQVTVPDQELQKQRPNKVAEGAWAAMDQADISTVSEFCVAYACLPPSL